MQRVRLAACDDRMRSRRLRSRKAALKGPEMIASARIKTMLAMLSTAIMTTACGAADDNAVPPDFKLVVHYANGGTDRLSWEATIKSDGSVSRTHSDTDGRVVRETYKLTTREMSDLLTKVRQTDFMKLKERYEGPAEDVDGFSISVTMDEKTHEVVVWDAGGQWGDRDVRGLRSLWNEILRKVPSPNTDQKSGATPTQVP